MNQVTEIAVSNMGKLTDVTFKLSRTTDEISLDLESYPRPDMLVLSESHPKKIMFTIAIPPLVRLEPYAVSCKVLRTAAQVITLSLLLG